MYRRSIWATANVASISCGFKRSLSRTLDFPPQFSRLSSTLNEFVQPTIYALSTQPGKAAIAVVRVTGPGCKYVYKQLTRRKNDPKPRSIAYSSLYMPGKPKDPSNVLDNAVILYFQGPKSYTGEDILELQLHGGNAIVKAVLNALMQLHNPDQNIIVRYAEAGEFSKRAFKNGVLDLTQVEGIRDAIDAETETQRKASLTSSSGRMRILYESWRRQIVDTMALLTALIDFSEDSDIASSRELFMESRRKVSDLLQEINTHYNQIKRSELLVSGIKLDFLGPPNAGKSLLLNKLAEREAAIVSDVPGTTRDVLELAMDISGFKVVLGDTAGLRSLDSKLEVKEMNPNDKIELEGMKRAKMRFRNSDIVLCIIPLSDKSANLPTNPGLAIDLIPQDVYREIKELKQLGKRVLLVLNKSDLLVSSSPDFILKAYCTALEIPVSDSLVVSCLTENGIDTLVQRLVHEFQDMTTDINSSSTPIGASQRTKDILQNDVVKGLENFLEIEDENDVVIATEELRFAAEGIGKITGQGVGVEEILGVVFSSFCIGK